VREVSFDALIGPTHHFGGMAPGNLAAEASQGRPSSPKKAALEGLRKVRAAKGAGARKGILPPQPRPDFATLHALGFRGPEDQVLARVHDEAPYLLRAASSASAMWVANAATVIPARDAGDGVTHVVVSNLAHLFHRSLEARGTERLLRAILPADGFEVHAPLPHHFADEGAANHLRLEGTDGRVHHVFAWGREVLVPAQTRRPARQTREASAALARIGALKTGTFSVVQQSSLSIDAGAFHTDVVATSAPGLLVAHELAFEDRSFLRTVGKQFGETLRVVVVADADLPLSEAVASYVLNSEVFARRDGSLVWIAPESVKRSRAATSLLASLPKIEPRIVDVLHAPLEESLGNGGGPACLRLRVPATEAELAGFASRVWVTDELLAKLEVLVKERYRDRLMANDLSDPALARETLGVIDDVTRMLGLGAVFDFQR